MKAILVTDMPSSCDTCDFVDGRHCYCGVPWFGKDVSDYVACRHEDCPLKELPQKPDYQPINENSYVAGYTACIDEILGDKE